MMNRKQIVLESTMTYNVGNYSGLKETITQVIEIDQGDDLNEVVKAARVFAVDHLKAAVNRQRVEYGVLRQTDGKALPNAR